MRDMRKKDNICGGSFTNQKNYWKYKYIEMDNVIMQNSLIYRSNISLTILIKLYKFYLTIKN